MSKLALWLLNWIADEGLAGDVIEQAGRGPAWVWGQVLAAGLSGLCRWPRRHRPEISFACAGTGIHLAVTPLVALFRLTYPTWPLELAVDTLTVALALPVLALGLTERRRQRLAATAVIASAVFLLPVSGFGWWTRVFGVMLVAATAGVMAGADRARAGAAS